MGPGVPDTLAMGLVIFCGVWIVTPHAGRYVSENIWKENAAETVSETKGENKNGTEECKEDYFLKVFLVGYT